MVQFRRDSTCSQGNRGMVEATAAVALRQPLPLNTLIASSVTSLAFQSFDKDKIRPLGYPPYVFWTLCIPSFPLILQQLSEAAQFSFYSSYIPCGCPLWPAMGFCISSSSRQPADQTCIVILWLISRKIPRAIILPQKCELLHCAVCTKFTTFLLSYCFRRTFQEDEGISW